MAKKWQIYIYLVLHNIDHRFQCRNLGIARFSPNKGKCHGCAVGFFDWLYERRRTETAPLMKGRKNA